MIMESKFLNGHTQESSQMSEITGIPENEAQRNSTDLEKLDFTETEQKIAETWSDILHIPLTTITRSDTLFGLGGNSIMIGEFMERGYSFLNLSILFQNFSLQDLAKIVDNIKETENLADPPIPIIPDKSSFPLSFEQLNMWNDIQEMIELSRTHQMLGLAVHTTINFDKFDENILRKSAGYIWNRHELLRSKIVVDEIPSWKPMGYPPMDFQIIDLTNLNHTDGVKVSLDFENNIMNQVIDLKSFPLIHFIAFKMAGGSGCLKIFTHHIIMDGFSTGLVRTEILECYHAFENGNSPNLEPLSIQYGDYSIWQKQIFEANLKFVGKLKSYWKKKLVNFKPLILPTNALVGNCNGHAVTEKHPGNFFALSFPETVSTQINVFNKEQATIPFVTLLAGLQVLLYRITGQTDIATLSISHGRSNPSTRNLIGHMMKFIILRNDLSGNPTFEDVVQAIHDDLMSSLKHQDYPFRSLLEDCCHGDADLQRQLYSTVVHMLPSNPNHAEEIFKQDFTHLENWMGSMGAEWVFQFQKFTDKDGQGFGVTINYHKNRFDSSGVENLIRKLSSLLEDGTMNPTTTIDQIQIC